LHLRSHGLSLAVSVTPPQNGPGGMAILILHDAAEFETRIGDAIRKATEGEIEFEQREVSGLNVTAADLPGTPGVEIGWWTDGGHLVITAGIGAVDAAASIGSRPGDGLTQHRLW